MTNLPQDYYVNLIKLLLKKSDYQDKFRLAEMIEREANRICIKNNAVSQAKTHLVAKVIVGGVK